MAELDPRVGRILKNTYRVRRRIGQGGMGVVYEATHLVLPTRYAIKFLQPGLRDDDLYRRFAREAEIAARQGSRHAVRIVDFALDEDQTPYMVMELLIGVDMARWLDARGKVPAAELLPVLQHLRAGLEPAHRAGIVHRDLKPENLFFHRTEEGEIVLKVMDFGVSKIKHSASVVTRDSAVLGTPAFMAPEQAIGRSGEVDARADIFAVGSMLYRALSGELPFAAPSAIGVMFKITAEEPPPLRARAPEVSEACAAVVRKAMAKAPEDRQANLSELVAEWAAALGAPAGEARSLESVRAFVESSIGPRPSEPPEDPDAFRTTMGTPSGPRGGFATPTRAGDDRPAPRAEHVPWHHNTRFLIAAVVSLAILVGGVNGILNQVMKTGYSWQRPPAPAAPALPEPPRARAPEPKREAPAPKPRRRAPDELPDDPINVDFRDMRIEDVLRFFAEEGDINIVPDQDVRGIVVTARLRDVPWETALRTVLRSQGLDFEHDEGVVRVAREAVLRAERAREDSETQSKIEAGARILEEITSAAQPVETRVIKLKRHRAAVVAPRIERRILSRRGRIDVDPAANAIILTEVPSRIEGIEELIRKLDEGFPGVVVVPPRPPRPPEAPPAPPAD